MECRRTMKATNDTTEEFEFSSLNAGQTVTVTVEATNGELKDDETWTDTLEYVEEQELMAQSRKVSHKFKHTETGKVAYLRFSADHKNNFGFVFSQRDQSEIDYDAMWQDPIRDDREWSVLNITA